METENGEVPAIRSGNHVNNNGTFIIKSIRWVDDVEILDKIEIYQTKNGKTSVISISKLGFAMLLIDLAKNDDKFYNMLRKIHAESLRAT